MAHRGKKYIAAREAVRGLQPQEWGEAIEKVIDLAFAKFDESVDLDIVLGIDPTKGDQVVRGSVLLPHGTGRKVRVVAFVKGDNVQAAKEAGADYVGGEELIKKIQEGWLDFEASVATPDMMGMVGKVARILGPRGLLPNKKVGTVTFDVVPVIKELKKGRISFKNDRGGSLHMSIGKVSFGKEKLLDNLKAAIKAVQAAKPQAAKGKFLKKMVISSTMGVGVPLKLEMV